MENIDLFPHNGQDSTNVAYEEMNEEELSQIAGGCWFKICKKCKAKKKEEKKQPWYIRLIRKESKKYENLLNSF